MDLTLAGAGQHVFGPLPADLKERRGVTADESEKQRFAERVKLGFRRAEEALQTCKRGLPLIFSDHFREFLVFNKRCSAYREVQLLKQLGWVDL